ncbi:hypothetical protein WJX73_001813 [Symbiochloris irregularis]|uniref:DUF1989 domain-containing protein n=1 Tax=Symbiochloris irregularis TaxID=706552 RepID=A0AAW1PDZ8_9CHLO
MPSQVIPARKGKAVKVEKGDCIKIINTSGQQVVDTWAFNAKDLKEVMSMEHTRSCVLKNIPVPGDTLVTNKRLPILTLIEDTCGVHDTLISACDQKRYELLGVTEPHDSCTSNMHACMLELGHTVPEPSISPLNLWMNVPVSADPHYTLKYDAPKSKAGDYVVLRAEIDCIVAMSACPNDILPVNGTGGVISDCHFEVLKAAT